MSDSTLPKEIKKELNLKRKELKKLEKEILSKRKKRSGAVIQEDIIRVNEEIVSLEAQIPKVESVEEKEIKELAAKGIDPIFIKPEVFNLPAV